MKPIIDPLWSELDRLKALMDILGKDRALELRRLAMTNQRPAGLAIDAGLFLGGRVTVVLEFDQDALERAL